MGDTYKVSPIIPYFVGVCVLIIYWKYDVTCLVICMGWEYVHWSETNGINKLIDQYLVVSL